MATRTPLREHDRSRVEHPHGLFERAEEWAEETGLDPDGEPGEGIPWHAAFVILLALGLLVAVEITLAFGIAKAVTGHAY
jgi:hypothetical protein